MLVFNTMGKRLEKFVPLKNKNVKLYTCGPTVYNYVHIGNLRAFVVYDLVKRYLEYKGYKVKHVMNITDVDDKTIRDSMKENVPLYVFTTKYMEAFVENIKELNIKMPNIVSGATQNIEEMIQLIQKLIDKGYAYLSNDSVYFSISKFKDYGKLSGIKVKELKHSRIKRDEYKKEIVDFALWKGWKKEDGNNFWDGEFIIDGKKKIIKGRPGWHIECSTIAMKYLGESIDIHMGGIDLIFPHHENEIAQSEAATGKKFVKYWLHNNYLLVNGEKMSKSLHNFYTLKDIKEKGFDPLALRFLYLTSHYRSILNFTFDSLKSAQISRLRYQSFYDKLSMKVNGKYNPKVRKIIEKYEKEFEKRMDNDFNTPSAMASVFDFISEINKLIKKKELNSRNLKEVKKFIERIDSVFGLLRKEKIPKEIINLLKKREVARKNKNYKLSDEIRKQINNLGYVVEDTDEGPVVYKK